MIIQMNDRSILHLFVGRDPPLCVNLPISSRIEQYDRADVLLRVPYNETTSSRFTSPHCFLHRRTEVLPIDLDSIPEYS